MKVSTAAGLVLLAGLSVSSAVEAQVRGTANLYNFDGDTPGKPPAGFTFALTQSGSKNGNMLGKPGKWRIEAQPDAPSAGNTLTQLDDDSTSARYPVAVTAGVFHSDIRVSTMCKAVAGKTEQTCGVVFRYVDENNHYVTSANVREGKVHLHHIKNGARTLLATWDGKVPGKVWNEIAAEAKGDTLRVYFNSQKVIEARDATFRAGGRAGVTTRADSVIYFDDFTVTSL